MLLYISYKSAPSSLTEGEIESAIEPE